MHITSKQLRELKAGKPTYAKEGDLVKDCLRWLRGVGCFVWKQNQGGMTGTHKGKSRFTRFAHVDGISDIIGISPSGRFIAVEAKQPGKKPTAKQHAFLTAIAANGGLAVVAHDLIELEAAYLAFKGEL